MKWLRLVLRVAALCAVLWLLAGKVHWQDRIEHGGVVHVGEVVSLTPERVEWLAADGTPQSIEVKSRAAGARSPAERPRVALGLRTTGARLLTRPGAVALVLCAMLVLVGLVSFRWLLLVRAAGLDMSVRSAVGLTFIGNFFNLVVPGSTGGDVVKAWYAARESGSGPRAVLSVFLDRAIGLLGLVLLAAVVLLGSVEGEGYRAARTVILYGLAASAVFLLLAFLPRLRRALGLHRLVARLPFQRVLGELRAGLAVQRKRPGLLLGSLGMSIVNHAGTALLVAALAAALGMEEATPLACLAVVPVANLLTAIPLAPGGWGVGEWAFATFFAPLGLPASEAVALSLLYRLLTLVSSLPGGVLWMFWRRPAAAGTIRSEMEAAAAVLAMEQPTP